MLAELTAALADSPPGGAAPAAAAATSSASGSLRNAGGKGEVAGPQLVVTDHLGEREMQLAAFACAGLDSPSAAAAASKRVGGTSTVAGAVDDHDTGVHSIVDGARFVDDRGQL